MYQNYYVHSKFNIHKNITSTCTIYN